MRKACLSCRFNFRRIELLAVAALALRLTCAMQVSIPDEQDCLSALAKADGGCMPLGADLGKGPWEGARSAMVAYLRAVSLRMALARPSPRDLPGWLSLAEGEL